MTSKHIYAVVQPGATNIIGSSIWQDHLCGSLRSMGWTVHEPNGFWQAIYDPLRSVPREQYLRDRSVRTEQVLADVKRVHQSHGLALFFGYLGDHLLDAAVLPDIRRLGIPTVNFACDNLRGVNGIAGVAAAADLNWITESAAIPIYQERGWRHIWLPMAANPDLCKPDEREESAVTFIGSQDRARIHVLGYLARAGVPLEIYGCGWPLPASNVSAAGQTTVLADASPRLWRTAWRLGRQWARHTDWKRDLFGVKALQNWLQQKRLADDYRAEVTPSCRGPVSDSEMYSRYARSQVTLGVNRLVPPFSDPLQPTTYVKIRDFEAPMCGACYITEFVDEHRQLYDLGTEIETWSTLPELLEKIQALLKDSRRRQRLKQNARRAALARHTWQARFHRLFEHLGIS